MLQKIKLKTGYAMIKKEKEKEKRKKQMSKWQLFFWQNKS